MEKGRRKEIGKIREAQRWTDILRPQAPFQAISRLLKGVRVAVPRDDPWKARKKPDYMSPLPRATQDKFSDVT